MKEEFLDRILDHPRDGYVDLAETIFAEVPADNEGRRSMDVDTSFRERYVIELANYELEGNSLTALDVYRKGYVEKQEGGKERDVPIKTGLVSATRYMGREVLFRAVDPNLGFAPEFCINKQDQDFPEAVLRAVLAKAGDIVRRRVEISSQTSLRFPSSTF